MAENTKIEWADHTFNPWYGCQRVGPGCDNCYAESWAKRSGLVQWGPGAERRLSSTANWKKPLKWNRLSQIAHDSWQRGIELLGNNEQELLARGFMKPQRPRVFCASLADVFDNAVPAEWRKDLFSLIAQTQYLDWLLVTKRIGNVMQMCSEDDGLMLKMLSSRVWLGITVCNQPEADRDIQKLLRIPAKVRFLSIEPLLGDIDLRRISLGESNAEFLGDLLIKRVKFTLNSLTGAPQTGIPGLNWVVVGGESDSNARPMHPQWARSLRDQCQAAGVPFFFKQWGEWTPEDWGERPGLRDSAGVLPSGEFALMSEGYDPPFDDDVRLEAAGGVRLDGRTLMDRVGKKAAGRLLDGRTWDEYPK